MKFDSSKLARYSLLLAITVLLVLPLVISVPLATERPVYQVNKPSAVKNTADLNDQEIPFNLQDFSNLTIFDVTKRISVNEWGYTIINTTVSIRNNGTSMFNYFNITVPLDEWEQYDHTSVVPEEIATSDPVIDSTANTVTWAFQTPDIETNGTYAFSIIAGSDSLAHPRTGVQQTSTTFPYGIEVVALPWLSVPINNLTIDLEVLSEAGSTFDNTTLSIASNLSDTEPEQMANDHYRLSLADLKTIDYDSLNETRFGGYNMDELVDQDIDRFIPAYMPSLATNLTSTVKGEYREGDGKAYVRYPEVSVSVSIDQWGTTRYTEKITIKHAGPEGTYIGGLSNRGQITIYASGDVIVDGARDSHGNLSVSVVLQTTPPAGFQVNLTKISINSRVPVSAGKNYTFTLKYHQPNEKVIDDRGGGKLVLKSSLLSLYNWTISSYRLTIEFPFMSSPAMPTDAFFEGISRTGSVRDFLIFEKPALIIETNNLTPFDNTAFEFTYGLPIYWFLVGPALLMLFFLIVGCLYVFFRLLSYRISPAIVMTAQEEIPYDLIESFVRSYEEKTALRERIRQLNEKRKRMKAKEYDKSLKIYENKQADVERQLVHSTTELSKRGPRYRSASRNIQMAESEREDVLRNLENLEKRKKSSRIDRETYIRLQRQYEKRLKKSNTTIDKVLIELRSLLTERVA
ncbi:MAG: hypothetical protein ACFFD4_00600 [Candidatus Odinarchaeota archaeon]